MFDLEAMDKDLEKLLESISPEYAEDFLNRERSKGGVSEIVLPNVNEYFTIRSSKVNFTFCGFETNYSNSTNYEMAA